MGSNLRCCSYLRPLCESLSSAKILDYAGTDPWCAKWCGHHPSTTSGSVSAVKCLAAPP